MLHKKNHLMRRGRVDEASALARRIGIKIERANKAHLRSIPPGAGTGEPWRRGNEVIGKKGPDANQMGLTADDLNKHSADISTDNSYTPPMTESTVSSDRPFIT